MRSRLPRLIVPTVLATILALPALAQKVKQGKEILDGLVIQDPSVWVGPSLVDADTSASSVKVDAFRQFRVATGGSWKMWLDQVTGNPSLVEGSGIPWIAGAGNQLVHYDHGQPMRVEEAPLVPRDEMVKKALSFMTAYPQLFGAKPEDLVLNEVATGPILDYLYYIHFNWTFHGIPVEGAQVLFRLNHGNLVQFGSDFISNSISDLDPTASVTLEEAKAIVNAFAHGDGKDVVVDPGRLVVMPVSAYPVTDAASPAPIAYRLAWVMSFRRPSVMGTWEARVDAHSGAILVFKDANLYGQIQGGTYVTDKPQVEGKRPFPYADYGAGTYADAAGVFPGTTGTSTMSGQFVNLSDTCGAASLAASGSGLIDFGTSAGTDCTTPGVGGAGNTHASRTQYFNVEAIREKAHAYLPANGWINSQLGVNVNINQTCNAYWDGTALNFFKSGGGCGNTGELPGVSLHEWGHGLDQNDGGPTGGSGESYSDNTWMVMGHVSCIGAGFTGSNCGGYGDPCTGCTGVRDQDYTKHSSNTPATPIGFDQVNCGGGGGGPCNAEVHCESAPSSQALWDLATNDLITWGLDQDSAWMLVDKLWFASRPTSGALFFACTNNTSCSAGHMFAVLRVVDDCDGNLANGTPHASAINAALGRHQISCNTAVNTDNNCACAALAAPVLSGTPGNNQNQLSWGAVTGATSYDVLRNEVGCNAGFIILANTASTTYTDTTVLNGFAYYYRVQARSSSSCPTSVVSNCTTLTPVSGPSADYVSGSAAQTADTGDNDGFPDNCETITVQFTLINDGAGALTNVRATNITSTAASVTVTSSFPINVGNLNPGGTANGTFTYTLNGAVCADNLPFTILVTADQMTGNNTGSFSFTAEQDVALVPLVTYSFETNLDGWTVTQGTFTRVNTYGGSAGTFALASSSGAINRCDGVVSPVIQPTASSTLIIGTHFDIEVFSGGSWWDRANIGVLVGTTRTVLTPTGGRTYNASGANGPCALGNDAGYAASFQSWADSSGFNLAAFAGQNVQLDVEYGTDGAVTGNGFRIDNIRVSNVMALSCDTQPDTCGGCPTITVSPASLPNGTVGTAYSQTVTASGGTAPYTFTVSAGALPTGLTLTAGGVLSGTPTAAGTFNFTIRATDAAACIGQRAYTVVMTGGCPAITLSPGSLPSGSVGTAYSQTITASGGTAPYTFAVTAGTLPTGLTLTAGGVLSGTPTTTGTFNFTVTATDAAACTGSLIYAVIINPAGCGSITLSPGSLPGGTVGIAYSQTVTASGGTAPYTFAVTAGTPPTGLTLASGGVLSGTPTAAGTFNFTVTATDSGSCQGAQAYSIVIGAASVPVDYVLGEGEGSTNNNRVRVYTGSGTATAVSFLAYGAGQWGTTVASGDVNGGSFAEILTGPGPGPSYGPQVRGFDRTGTGMGKINFYAYSTLKYGVNVGSSNLDGDGFAEIISGAGPGAAFGPHVRGFNFDNTTLTPIAKVSYFAYGTLKYGVNVEDGNVDGDAFGEILTGPGPGAIFGPQVRGWNYDAIGLTSINKINFSAFALSGYGVNVAGGDVDNDGFAEIAVAPGPGPSHPSQFRGFDYNNTSITPLAGYLVTPFTTLFGGRVGLGDLRADGRWDLIAAPGRDIAALNPTVMSYDYNGTALTANPGVPFTPFAGDRYGVNVSAGALGY